MFSLKIYQICHHLITYFATLTSPKKSQLGPIFRTGASIIFLPQLYYKRITQPMADNLRASLMQKSIFLNFWKAAQIRG